jgi:assimilatory nitrate reductase catalytic subunit
MPPAEEPDEEFPLILTTGRVIYHYLSGNQTRRVPFLNEQAPYPWVEIHTQTASDLGIHDGDWVRVCTRRGEMTVPALLVQSIRPDTIFIPYHYGHQQAVNQLTNPVLEPMMKIPEYKVCAASATRTVQRPAWARDQTDEQVQEAYQHRHELPTAHGHPTPVLGEKESGGNG